MKTTVVPAQVTTVEDKIAGNLSFSQLLLMTIPVFVSGALFALFPPMMNVTLFKILVCTVLAIICLTLAIRIKGKLIAQWLGIMMRYNARPRFYVFNKNEVYLRQPLVAAATANTPEILVEPKHPDQPDRALLPTHERARLELSMADPRAKFHLKATKGGLRVYISEIKKESL